MTELRDQMDVRNTGQEKLRMTPNFLVRQLVLS